MLGDCFVGVVVFGFLSGWCVGGCCCVGFCYGCWCWL